MPARISGALSLFACAGALGAIQPPEPSPAPGSPQEAVVAPYTRVVEERDGEVVKLQMAVREFAPPTQDKPRVYLAAAVHIGNDAFYKDLQKFLDAQDVVLFEGVKPPGAGSAEHERGEQGDAAKGEATGRRVRFLAMAVERYRKKNGRLPESLDELADKSEGRVAQLLKSSLDDAWGRRIEYVVLAPTAGPKAEGDSSGPMPARFDVVSLGSDGRPGGEGPAADVRFLDQAPLKKTEMGDRSQGLQQKLADALGMVFQLTAMDHNKRNWRNSDLSVDQIQARLEAAGASADALFSLLDGSSVLGRLAGALLGMMASSPEQRAMMRVMMIEMLGRADQLMSVKMPGDMGAIMPVILEDRNRVLLADLKRVIETEPAMKTVAVIYGGGHLPGIERALVGEMGYKPAGDTWRTAMEVDAKEAGVSVEQLRQTRQTMARVFQAQMDAGKKKTAPRAAPAEPGPAR